MLNLTYVKDMAWTEETYSQLIKAMSKYPVGTPQRWEKIATLLERPEKEVGIICY